MSIFFRPGRTDLNHIFLHKYTLHKRYKSQLKTFAVEVASFQIESHSSLERTPPRSAAPRFVCSEKHNVHVHFDEIFSSEIFTASFFFQLIQSNQLVGAFFKSENHIFCHHNLHFSQRVSFQLS